MGVDEEDNLGPPSLQTGGEKDEVAEWARLSLVQTKDERYKSLKERFATRIFPGIKEYKVYSFSNAWEWESVRRGTGEVGRLLSYENTVEQWSHAFYRRD